MPSDLRRILPTLAVVAALSCAAATDVDAADADGNDLLTDYSLTSWHEADGRPLGTVYAIAQGTDGYLWVGSDAGLFRFDGSRFIEWSALSDTPLPAGSVTALCVTHDGTLWAGLAEGAGIWRIREGRALPAAEGIDTARSIVDIVEDTRGTMWSVADGELLQRTADRWQRTPLPWTRRGPVMQVHASRSGNIWVATRWGTFVRPADADAFRPTGTGFIWGVSESPSGDAWTTDVAFGFRRLGAAPPARAAHQGAGHRLIHDRDGNLWVGTFSEGLWRVAASGDATEPRVDRADLRTGLTSDSVQTLLEDRSGNVWIGTTGGLHRFARRTLLPVDNIGFVVTAEPADGSKAWIARTNGIVALSPARESWTRARPGSAGPDIRSLYRDRDGTLWVGASEGLYREVNGRLVPIAIDSDDDLAVLSILPAAGGGLWLGNGQWLYRWDGAHLSPLDVAQYVPGVRRINFSAVDGDGRLWLQFAEQGFGFVDRGGAFHAVLSPTQARRGRENVYALCQDHEGTIWIGSSAGLARFVNGGLQRLSQANGMPEGRVWAIVEDLQGRLWLSVDRGIVRLDRAELRHAAQDPSYRLRYRLYDALDGVAGAAIGVIRSIRASDGTLWFVRGGGLTLLDPRTIGDALDLAPPPVQIDTVVANDRRLPATAGLSFPPGVGRVAINYSALTLGTSNRVRFRYRLDGIDTSWIEAGARRGAAYTNLAPGRYRFHLQAVMEEGAGNVTDTAWEFSVQPAFYQTTWFAVVAIAAFAAGLWGIWRLRLRMVHRQYEMVLAERARMSREIHDTLLQSLVGVMLQFDAISKNIAPASSAARDQLQRLRRRVEAHIRDARQSIHNLRSPLLDRRDLVKALIEFGTNTVADTPVQFDSAVLGTPHKCPPELESQLLRIGQEAIVNAVRHAGARTIHLELRFEPQSLTMSVTDDGCGFVYDDRGDTDEGHYGLTMMRERAEQLDSVFTIVSGPGRGTRVTVVMPIRGAVEDLSAVEA